MGNWILDTNILIYYFNGNMDALTQQKVSEFLKNSFQISIVTKMEFLGFPFSEAEKHKAIQFINCATIHPLSDGVVDRVIQIRQLNRIKLPDAIIAATAMYCSAKLVTRNTKDFTALKFETYNPFVID